MSDSFYCLSPIPIPSFSSLALFTYIDIHTGPKRLLYTLSLYLIIVTNAIGKYYIQYIEVRLYYYTNKGGDHGSSGETVEGNTLNLGCPDNK